MGDDLVGQGHMTQEVIDSFSSRGALIDDAELVSDFTRVSFTSHLYDLVNASATFDNGNKLLARLCFLNEKLSCEQAAGILFAVRRH